MSRPKAWVDDPWSELRPEQAWRAGWEAARKQAMQIAAPPQNTRLPCSDYDISDAIAVAITAMGRTA